MPPFSFGAILRRVRGIDMINKELKVYFKALNIELIFYPSGLVKKFYSIKRFYAYYSAELENWNKQGSHFNEIKKYLQNIYPDTKLIK